MPVVRTPARLPTQVVVAGDLHREAVALALRSVGDRETAPQTRADPARLDPQAVRPGQPLPSDTTLTARRWVGQARQAVQGGKPDRAARDGEGPRRPAAPLPDDDGPVRGSARTISFTVSSRRSAPRASPRWRPTPTSASSSEGPVAGPGNDPAGAVARYRRSPATAARWISSRRAMVSVMTSRRMSTAFSTFGLLRE